MQAACDQQRRRETMKVGGPGGVIVIVRAGGTDGVNDAVDDGQDRGSQRYPQDRKRPTPAPCDLGYDPEERDCDQQSAAEREDRSGEFRGFSESRSCENTSNGQSVNRD